MTNENVKIDQRFVVQLQGKNFVTYEGLLDLAHQNGLVSMDIEIIQIPTKENDMTAICRATAKTKDTTYTDVGDASPGSVTRNLVPHIIRMASTRAKARALRDLTNVGMTAYEEMDIFNEYDKAKDSNKGKQKTNKYQKKKEGSYNKTQSEPGNKLTKEQLDSLYQLAETKEVSIGDVKTEAFKTYKKTPELLGVEEYNKLYSKYKNM